MAHHPSTLVVIGDLQALEDVSRCGSRSQGPVPQTAAWGTGMEAMGLRRVAGR
jgi:hypothetical protein